MAAARSSTWAARRGRGHLSQPARLPGGLCRRAHRGLACRPAALPGDPGHAGARARFIRVDITRSFPVDDYHGYLLLDVLEHLPDDVAVMRLARPHAGRRRQAGPDRLRSPRTAIFVLLTLPAFPALWSPWDDLEKHKRRYTRATARRLCEQAGFEVIRTTCFFFPLFFAALAVKAVRLAAPQAGRPDRPADAITDLAEGKTSRGLSGWCWACWRPNAVGCDTGTFPSARRSSCSRVRARRQAEQEGVRARRGIRDLSDASEYRAPTDGESQFLARGRRVLGPAPAGVGWVDYLPTNDGPQHIFTAHALHRLDDPALGYGRYLEPGGAITDIGFEAVFGTLERFLPCGRPSASPSACLHWAGLGACWPWRQPWTEGAAGSGCWASPRRWQWLLYMGLFSYYLSLALGFGVLAFAFSRLVWRRRDYLVLVGLLVAQACAHVVPTLAVGCDSWVLLALFSAPAGARALSLVRTAVAGAPGRAHRPGSGVADSWQRAHQQVQHDACAGGAGEPPRPGFRLRPLWRAWPIVGVAAIGLAGGWRLRRRGGDPRERVLWIVGVLLLLLRSQPRFTSRVGSTSTCASCRGRDVLGAAGSVRAHPAASRARDRDSPRLSSMPLVHSGGAGGTTCACAPPTRT